MIFVYLILADKFKCLQRLYCKIGWHCCIQDYSIEDYDDISFNEITTRCKCKWCGKDFIYKDIL